MTDKLDVVDVLGCLGEPYTLRRKYPKRSWWSNYHFGNPYLICYDDQPIRELSDTYENTKALVILLNRAYQTGAADCMSIRQTA